MLTPILIGQDERLFDEGEIAKHLFLVTEGVIRLQRTMLDGRRQVIGFQYPGDFLGFATQGRYAYSAEGVIDSRLDRFPRRKIMALLLGAPPSERRFVDMLSFELTLAQDHMLLLGRKNGIERLASFFLMLSRRAVRRGESGNPIHLPMNRRDVADYLGLTKEYVSRSFTKLKLSKLIEPLSPDNVSLLDIDKLTKIASGELVQDKLLSSKPASVNAFGPNLGNQSITR